MERVALVLIQCRVTGLLVVRALQLANGYIHPIPSQCVTLYNGSAAGAARIGSRSRAGLRGAVKEAAVRAAITGVA